MLYDAVSKACLSNPPARFQHWQHLSHRPSRDRGTWQERERETNGSWKWENLMLQKKEGHSLRHSVMEGSQAWTQGVPADQMAISTGTFHCNQLRILKGNSFLAPKGQHLQEQHFLQCKRLAVTRKQNILKVM